METIKIMHSTRPIIVVLLLIISLPLLGFTPSEEQLAAVEQLTALPVQTYKQPFNDEIPEESQRDKGLVYLTPDDIIQLNSPLIFAAITWHQYNEQHPLELYLLDRPTLYTLLHRNPVVKNAQQTRQILQLAQDFLRINFTPQAIHLQQLPPQQLCQLYKEHPHLEQAAHAALCNKFLFIEQRKLFSPTRKVLAAITLNKQYVIIAHQETTIYILDLSTGRLLKTIGEPNNQNPRKGHTSAITSLAFAPDGTYIISGSYDGIICVWNLITGELCHILDYRRDNIYIKPQITSLVVTHDGKYLINGTSDNTIDIWDLPTGKLFKTCKGHKRTVSCLVATPDSKHVISGSFDDTIRIWDLATGELRKTLKDYGITSLQVTPNGQYLVSGGHETTLNLWDLSSGELLKPFGKDTFKGHTRTVRSLALTPDGQHIISCSDDCTIRVWDMLSGALLHTIEHSSNKYVAVVSDRQFITCNINEGLITSWQQESLHDFCKRMGVDL